VPLLEQIGDIVRNDIDPDFLKSFSISMGWAYSDLYEELAALGNIGEAYGLEEFARRRSGCAVRALALAARQHGIPYEFKYLGCNGQSKLIAKVGRVVLIQEPILTLEDDPRVSEYKRELAESHGLVRQLELELGDRPVKNQDWSGCVLGVLLHGAAGPRFTREHRALGALMLAIPDASYSNWILRLDLHSMAINGYGFEVDDRDDTELHQPDKVHVTLKRRNIERETGA
jgi:hypothetical protein